MKVIFSYLRLILFLGGVLVGIQVPGFVDQYGKSLKSHFIESETNLNEFKDDAEKYFGGDMEKLIVHYKKDKDPVFTSGGESIDSIYQRNTELKVALADFNSGTISAYFQVFLTPVKDIKSEVWRDYTYSIRLDPSAISVGLVTGLLIAVLAEIFLRIVFVIIMRIGSRLQPAE